jgi:hypothetical protein
MRPDGAGEAASGEADRGEGIDHDATGTGEEWAGCLPAFGAASGEADSEEGIDHERPAGFCFGPTLSSDGSNLLRTNGIADQGQLRDKRICAHTVGGTQVCAAGVGVGLEFGTYPGSWTCESVLQSGWVTILKTPAINETAVKGIHWEENEFEFKCIILLPSRIIAVPVDRIGDYNTVSIVVMDTAIGHQYESKICHAVDGLSTPPTPPAGSSQHPWSC